MGRRRREAPGGVRYLEVRGSRRERNNNCFNIGEAGRAEFFCSEASEVPSSRLAEFTVGRPRVRAENMKSRLGPRVRRLDPGVLLETARTCRKRRVPASNATENI